MRSISTVLISVLAVFMFVPAVRVSVGGVIVGACTADIYACYVGKCAFVEDKEFTNTIYYYSNYTAAIAQGICTALKGTWAAAE